MFLSHLADNVVMSTVNLTDLLSARKDRYARALGAFTLSGNIEAGSDAVSVWEFLMSQNGKQFRVLTQCLDGTVRDMIGRGGVFDSKQDGTVEGIGQAMTNPDKLTLSLWTATHGKKVNTGAGKGYRTLKAENIIAIHAQDRQILTAFGLELLRATGAIK
jgi:hypothetical protein